jgi:AraC family transcriptional activator of tynA and feaB
MQQWSSFEISACDRLAFWVDAVCRTLVRLRCEPQRDQDFFGEIGCDELGPLKLVSVQSIAQRVTRLTDQPDGPSADFYHINIMQGGRGLMDQNGHEAELGPGGFVFSDSGRPYSINFVGSFSSSVLRIPRSMLLQRVGALDRFTALRVDGVTGLDAMVTSMLRELPAHLPAISASARERVAENIVDLIAAALLSAGERAPESARITLTRVKFWIETHLPERLSGEKIAGQCGLSVRHLNRLFASEGTSLMHHVWERRLARAHRDLIDPAMGHRSISDIALSVGFSDLSHFSRAYRDRYGVPPRDARSQA